MPRPPADDDDSLKKDVLRLQREAERVFVKGAMSGIYNTLTTDLKVVENVHAVRLCGVVDQGPWPKMETSCHFLRKHSLCAEHKYLGGRNLV